MCHCKKGVWVVIVGFIVKIMAGMADSRLQPREQGESEVSLSSHCTLYMLEIQNPGCTDKKCNTLEVN